MTCTIFPSPSFSFSSQYSSKFIGIATSDGLLNSEVTYLFNWCYKLNWSINGLAPFTILAFILIVNCDVYSSLNGPYNIGGSLGKLCPCPTRIEIQGQVHREPSHAAIHPKALNQALIYTIRKTQKKTAIPANPGQRYSYRRWEYVIYYEVKGNSWNLVVTKLFRMLCHCLFWGARYCKPKNVTDNKIANAIAHVKNQWMLWWALIPEQYPIFLL